MVDWGFEENRGWRIRVIWGELERELECKTCVGCVVWSIDRCCPFEKVAFAWKCRDAGRGRGHKLHQFGLQTVILSNTFLWWITTPIGISSHSPSLLRYAGVLTGLVVSYSPPWIPPRKIACIDVPLRSALSIRPFLWSAQFRSLSTWQLTRCRVLRILHLVVHIAGHGEPRNLKVEQKTLDLRSRRMLCKRIQELNMVGRKEQSKSGIV